MTDDRRSTTDQAESGGWKIENGPLDPSEKRSLSSILHPQAEWRSVVALLATAILSALFLWRTVLPAARADSYAFSAYYTAARLALRGEAGARLCDAGWFFAQQRALGFGERADFFCPNPPTTALLLAPVAWLPPRPARIAWIALDVLMALAAVWVGLRGAAHNQELRTKNPTQASMDGSWFLVLGSVVLGLALFKPLHADMHAGQVYTLLALLYALWLAGYLSGRDWLCGLALALLALAKLAGWPLWLLLLAGRRWRALGWAAGAGLALGLLTLPLFGLDFWLLYLLRQAPAISSDPLYAAPAFQTLASLLGQLFAYDAQWSPAPLLDAPGLARGLWWLLAALLLLATLRLARRAPAHAGLAALCLVVPLQPAGEEYHYALLLPVLAALVQSLSESRQSAVGSQESADRLLTADCRLPAALLGFALALLAAPAYFLAGSWAGWPWAPLAYPRLYGALLLWAAIITRASAVQTRADARMQAAHADRTVW